MSFRTCIAALLTGISLSATAQNSGVTASVSLSELVDRGWLNTQQERALTARQDEVKQRELATRSWFAGSPAVGIDLRRDLPRGIRLPGSDISSERGKNEWEPAFTAPMWLPGQANRQRDVIRSEASNLSQNSVFAKWQLAGEVREAVWSHLAAKTAVHQAKARLGGAGVLEQDVAKRTTAGDLTRADLWMAQIETRSAQANLAESELALSRSSLLLQKMFGLADIASGFSETVATNLRLDEQPTPAHPAVLSRVNALELARQKFAYANAVRRDNPVFSVVGRFDRDGNGLPYRNTVRMGVSIPLDTESRNSPKIAQAAAEITQAEIDLDLERRATKLAIEQASITHANATVAVDLQAQRAKLASQAHIAIELAFKAGERSLPELLRARNVWLEAEQAKELSVINLGQATARLNQSLGVMP